MQTRSHARARANKRIKMSHEYSELLNLWSGLVQYVYKMNTSCKFSEFFFVFFINFHKFVLVGDRGYFYSVSSRLRILFSSSVFEICKLEISNDTKANDAFFGWFVSF